MDKKFLAKAIARIADHHPNLSASGFAVDGGINTPEGDKFAEDRAFMFTDVFAEQVRVCLEAFPQKKDGGWAILKRTSYGLKHAVEYFRGHHRWVSEGAAIVALMMLGYQPRGIENHKSCGFKKETRRVGKYWRAGINRGEPK